MRLGSLARGGSAAPLTRGAPRAWQSWQESLAGHGFHQNPCPRSFLCQGCHALKAFSAKWHERQVASSNLGTKPLQRADLPSNLLAGALFCQDFCRKASLRAKGGSDLPVNGALCQGGSPASLRPSHCRETPPSLPGATLSLHEKGPGISRKMPGP